ncbi:1011_t:CDS:2, partial [Ambispora leptoticha]
TLNSPDDSNTTKVTESTISQTSPETCSLCNNSVLLYKPNGANLELIAKLTCVHTFHLKCIVNSLKENPDLEKFLKELSLWPIVFTQLPDPENEKIENFSTSQMDFPKIYDKILKGEKNLKKQIREITYTKYEILDSYYLLGKVLEDKKFTDNEIKIIKERSKKIPILHSKKQTNKDEELEYNTDMEID